MPDFLCGLRLLSCNLWRLDQKDQPEKKKFSVKFGFSEKATKFEKNLCRTFDKSVVFCARNSLIIKKSTKIFKNKYGQVLKYTNFNCLMTTVFKTIYGKAIMYLIKKRVEKIQQMNQTIVFALRQGYSISPE